MTEPPAPGRSSAPTISASRSGITITAARNPEEMCSRRIEFTLLGCSRVARLSCTSYTRVSLSATLLEKAALSRRRLGSPSLAVGDVTPLSGSMPRGEPASSGFVISWRRRAREPPCSTASGSTSGRCCIVRRGRRGTLGDCTSRCRCGCPRKR